MKKLIPIISLLVVLGIYTKDQIVENFPNAEGVSITLAGQRTFTTAVNVEIPEKHETFKAYNVYDYNVPFRIWIN